jgi:hypothetical protein
MIRVAFAIAALALSSFPTLANNVVIDVGKGLVADQGVILRGLDRINGATVDFEITPGGSHVYERLEITLTECRYPDGEAQVEGFAYLQIRDIRQEELSFEGWMFASSPALSALDHPRYDVWVLSCKT